MTGGDLRSRRRDEKQHDAVDGTSKRNIHAMPYLKLIKGGPHGRVFDIPGDRAVIGRHEVCDICTKMPSVSRKHAVIESRNGGWYLRDLGSSNGTFVNDAEARPPDGLLVQETDCIQLAELLFTFHESNPDAPTEVEFQQDDVEIRRVMTRKSLTPVEKDFDWFIRLLNCTAVRDQLIRFGRSLLDDMEVNYCTILPCDPQTGDPTASDGISILRDPDDLSDQGRIESSANSIHAAALTRVMEAECAVSYTVRVSLAANGSGVLEQPHMLAPLIDTAGNRRGVVHCWSDVTGGSLTMPQGGFPAVELNWLYWRATVFANALIPSGDCPAPDVPQSSAADQLPVARPQRPGYEFFDFDIRSARCSDLFLFEDTTPNHVAMVLLFRWHNEDECLYRMQVFSREIPHLLNGIDSAERAMQLLQEGFARLRWNDHLAAMVAIVDTQTHKVKVARAGMRLPPLIKDASGVEDVGLHVSPPFGVDLDEGCAESEIELQPGQSLIMFSDGILSAELRTGEIVNADRVRNLATEAPIGAQELGKFLHDRLSLDLKEDVSFMVAHRTV